jgi:hypothetical protein
VSADVTNPLGRIDFTDVAAQLSQQRFYRAVLQSPPTNMVFIPANTFTMGGPTNDLDRSIFEGPQTTVTLTRGFWIGKYEVTQGEYLTVTGENPSDFPGDLRSPISSVSWFDATNYCWKLTQRELAAGRIPVGSNYRLPTEAEWEYAARAGTTTAYWWGDEIGRGNANCAGCGSAWDNRAPAPVGSFRPNAFGLIDSRHYVGWRRLDQPTQILRAGVGYKDPLSSFARHNFRTPGGHPEGYLEAFGNIYRNFALTLSAKIDGTEPTKEMLDFPKVDEGIRGMAFIDNVVKSAASKEKWTEFQM